MVSIFIARSLLSYSHNFSPFEFLTVHNRPKKYPSVWCFWIWHLTADTMVTVPSVRHEIVGCKMHQNWYIGFLGHSATSAPDHIFVYEEMLVCKMRWCRPLVIDGSQEIKKRWLLFITGSLPECCTAQQLI